jgi:SAM-dependent methyltransferase
VDRDYQQYQYGDSEKLRIRVETHRLCSDQPDRLRDGVIAQLALMPGLKVLDVGCGPGGYHESIWNAGAQVVGVDASFGMVREARANAVDGERGVHVAQADAQALPFRDGAFDRVLAAHMLYHVPDRAGALREMRRVLRIGGRAVLATNGVTMLARLDALHQEAATSLGYTPTSGDGSRFTLNDLELVQAVFPAAERHVLDNALVFHDPEPALRYYASGIVDRIRSRPVDGSHRAQLLAHVRAGLEAIIKNEGEFRDPKPTGYFVANVTTSRVARQADLPPSGKTPA